MILKPVWGTLVSWKAFVSPETISHPDGSEDMEKPYLH